MSAVMVPDHMPVDRCVQRQWPVESSDVVQLRHGLALLVGGHQPHARFGKRLDHGVSITIDGGIEDVTSIDIGIRGDVGAASSQSEAEGSAGADNHVGSGS